MTAIKPEEVFGVLRRWIKEAEETLPSPEKKMMI
jgi:hypothetical protein|tara:strand:- start:705 stop:806 length:102 start_codon:yes stop_codon:yes gene_type:complete